MNNLNIDNPTSTVLLKLEPNIKQILPINQWHAIEPIFGQSSVSVIEVDDNTQLVTFLRPIWLFLPAEQHEQMMRDFGPMAGRKYFSSHVHLKQV